MNSVAHTASRLPTNHDTISFEADWTYMSSGYFRFVLAAHLFGQGLDECLILQQLLGAGRHLAGALHECAQRVVHLRLVTRRARFLGTCLEEVHDVRIDPDGNDELGIAPVLDDGLHLLWRNPVSLEERPTPEH